MEAVLLEGNIQMLEVIAFKRDVGAQVTLPCTALGKRPFS